MSATVRNLGGGGGKVQGYIIPASDSVSISGFTGTTETVALNIIGDGALSVSSSDSTKATGSISGNILTITAVASGNVTITITMADSSTYLGTTATISVKSGIITIGNTYFFGGFYWTAAEDLGDNAVCLQSQGMTAGAWPGYKLTTDYTGTKNYGNANTGYSGNIDGDNIANYDDVTSAWYSKYSAVEKTGASYGSGLFLVSNAKCGTTTSGQQGSGNYLDALKTAGLNYILFGGSTSRSWIGTSNSSQAWFIGGNTGNVLNNGKQNLLYVIAPAFNLDLTKVKLDGSTIMLLSESKPAMVSFASATPAQREAIVRAYEAGIIDITEYWTDGEEATATLPAIAASGTGWTVGESHASQEVTLVLSLDNCKELVTVGANGQKNTKFLYHQKNCLEEAGYMNSTATNTGSWESSARRGWCNNGYKAAMIQAFGDIFHELKNVTAQTYNGTTNQTSNDYFASAAEKEITGSDSYSNTTEANALKLFKFYETSSNRIKKQGNNGSAVEYWQRSPHKSMNSRFLYIHVDGNANSGDNANFDKYIAPFGGV